MAITGEATPYYLFHPLVPERVAATLPDVRLIVLLRDPVARAISHYHHERKLGSRPSASPTRSRPRTSGSRAEARIVEDPSYASFAHQHFSYKARGRYAPQLERWLTTFPGEQLLIVDANALFEEPAREFERVTSFLGLPTRAATPSDRTTRSATTGARDRGAAP